MKTKTILRLLSLLCLFFASCNDEQAYPPGGGQVPAVFTSGFAGAGAPAVGSRAANAAWTAGDAVGIYMIDSENYALASAWKKNRKYTVGNLSTGELTPDGTENIMYYPPNATVRFVAYSPYSGEATAAGQATYSLTDQSTQAKKEAADFVFYRGTTDRSDTDPAETLTFKHRFSKINITVRRDADAPSCAGLVVALTGMPAAVTVDLSAMAADATQTGTTGMSTGTTSAAITPWISASTAASATAEAIVAPHAGTGSFTGRTLTFTAGDDTFTYPLPNGLTFEPGKVYTFDFSLTKVAVLLNQSVITNWNAGDIEQTDDITFGANSALHTVGYDATSSQLTLVTEASTAVPMVTRSTSATDRLAGAPAWLTAATFGAPATADGMTRRVLTVTTTVNDGALRTGYLWVTFMGVSCVITVNQITNGNFMPAEADRLANAYIVSPNGAVSFPVTRAYTAGTVDQAASQNFTAEVLWKDADCVNAPTVSGSGRAATISVTAKATQGNAVIALKQGGTIVWSYHIWISDIDLSKTWNPVNYGGTSAEYMDRNLGASAATPFPANPGLYYQMGRKDPFPGELSGIPTVQIGTAAMTLAETISNPHIIVPYDIVPYGSTLMSNSGPWITPVSDYLWLSSQGKKTIFDPCPAGWRVPVQYYPVGITYTSADVSISADGVYSLNLGENGIFNAGGGKYSNTWGHYNLKTGVSLWSCSKFGDLGETCYYNSTGISINTGTLLASNGQPGTALSVRCVKE